MATSASASQFGEVTGFYVEADGTHVVMDVHDYDEGVTIPVRVSKADLTAMADASPRYATGPPQVSTPPLSA